MGVSIVLAVMNVIWKFVCEKLTYFERHYTWSRHVYVLMFKTKKKKRANLKNIF